MSGLPMVVPAPGLPEKVTIYEVGPRDGLQNEKALIPTEVKAEFVRRLVAAGLPVVEATSFVHPKWVPQLADAADLMELLGDSGKDLPVLVPNQRGLDRALELGLRHIAVFGSATETFAAKNLNSTLDDQFAMFTPTVERALAAGVDVRAYVSMCFGDPWEGAVPIEQVVAVGRRLLDLGHVGERARRRSAKAECADREPIRAASLSPGPTSIRGRGDHAGTACRVAGVETASGPTSAASKP